MLPGPAYPGLSGGAVREARPSACAPPKGFRSAEGVRRAWPEATGPFGPTPSLRGKSAAQKAGLRYERKVIAELIHEYPEGLLPHQWFKWEDDSGLHWCQLDALHYAPDVLTLFEVKSRFTSDAWHQLRRLYEPVTRRAYYMTPARCVIICRNFDPWTRFPEPYTVITSLRDVQPDVLNVLPWRL
jgi:hypothetical protein